MDDLIEELRREIARKTEFLERRKKLFAALGDIFQDEQNSPKTKAYIFALWRYIADVHGENIFIEIEEEDGDG